MRYFKKNWLEIFFTKVALNLKSETRKTYLSYLWWILEPALLVGVFYLVFKIFLNRGTDDFLVFLLCGKIPFLWFSKTVSHASGSIMTGRGLISQMLIPKAFFPLLLVAEDSVKQCFVFAFLFISLGVYGVEISANWFYVIPIILTQLLLIIAFSFFTASITPFFPDFKHLVNAGMMMLMFGSGIFYSYKDVLLDQHQVLFLLNPVANLIKNYRDVLLEGMPPDWNALFMISLFSTLLIILMLNIYRKADSTYARLVIQ